MAKTQEFIDDLITVIDSAEAAESVTNQMVAAVFDFLNESLKKVSNSTEVQEEAAARIAADLDLKEAINKETADRTKANSILEQATAAITSRIDKLVGNNASQAIDNFNEIIAFLNGIKDTESLTGLLAAMNERIGTENGSSSEDGSVWGKLRSLIDDFTGLTQEVSILDSQNRDSHPARFDGIVEDAEITLTSSAAIGQIIFVKSKGKFAFRTGSEGSYMYHSNWPSADDYLNADRTKVLTEKIYLSKNKAYVYNGGSLYPADNEAIELSEKVSQRVANLTQYQHGTNINVNRLLDTDNVYSGLIAAIAALKGAQVEGFQKNGIVLTFLTADGWESKQFTGNPDTEFETEDKWEDFGSAAGGGNTFNATERVPLNAGLYYTLSNACRAVPDKERKRGLCITYEVSLGKWETKQFIGTSVDSWEQAASWEDFGGKGTVKSVTVNGKKQTPDATGNVNVNVDVLEVDETLSADSTNPVENKVIAARFDEVDASTLFNVDVEVNEDESSVRLSFQNKSGAEITAVDIPAGSGGGSGETVDTKIVLNAAVDNSIIKEGGNAILTYTYDHQYTTGDDKGTPTGQKADITVTIKRGTTTMYSNTVNDVSKGSYKLDLSSYLLVGTTEIYVAATAIDPITGKKQTKQAFTTVKMVTLSLSSSYNLAGGIANGGYASADTVSIPYAVNGSGVKVVTLYLNGKQQNAHTITRSGTTNSSFNLSGSALATGRNTVQIVAEMEASAELVLKSESIYIDILKAGETAPFIGTMHSFTDGRIFTENHLMPRLEVGQYEQVKFDFVAYDPQTTPANVDVYRDGIKSQSVSVGRTTQVYTNRFTEKEEILMEFKTGDTEYPFYIDVTESSIDLSEVTAGLVLKLSAAGRSNSEAVPGTWEYNDIQTVFDKFDWKSNGWTGDALKLTNGANIEIGYKPFATDATTTGATYEMEIKCSSVTDRQGIVLDCMAGNIGFQMTTEEALMRVSGGTEVSRKFASDLDLKIAFVIGNKAGHRLLELYINGSRCGEVQYSATEGLLQETPVNIKIGSEAADVEIRNFRIYNRALTDDEELSNYMVDRATSDEMVILFENNDVTGDNGTDIDLDKLRAKGKAVMRIVGDVNLVNATNNKKFEVPVDVYFYSPYGKEYDFVARNIGLRIQGTSSTTYPRKNYRLYFSRLEKYGTTLEVNGVDVPSLEYSFKPGARPISIFCLKADFSDSSSTHNTGGVRIVNDVWKKCGWLTPPQAAYKGEYDVRIGVDGFPIDLFYDNDGTGINTYLGKYNFNNEKSDSAIVYGFEGIEGFNDKETLAGQRNKCICVEFLNNSHPLCLFGTSNITEEEFGDGLEFRFKPDKTWADADPEDKDAVKRLWTWINGCKGNPTKFLNEYKQYFGNDSPFAWYLLSDYFMAVDNRAKNMMLATWDGKIWYFLPYDLDTLFGVRNDSVLKYDYTITHETFDDSIGSYAFAGHDSVLWELVRGCPDKLREVAETLRSNMSLEYVLKVFNEEMMGNWCERIYNKDAEYKYILPLTQGVTTSEGTNYYNYLYALQGNRFAHRTYTIQNRFALLDSQYVAGTYRRDSFATYFGYKFSNDNRKIKITSSERYYFGYGYTSGTPHQSAVLAEAAGSLVELTMDTDLIVNDPQYFYGASRISGLDLTDVSHAIVGTLNLNNCTALRTLNASCAGGQTTLNALLVGNCRNLRELNVSGLKSSSFTGIDLSTNTKMETFRAGNTSLTGVTFAQGAPLALCVLPSTLQTLELRYLNQLSNAGLQLEGTRNITRLVVDNCALIDWNDLLNQCNGTRYLRITGIDTDGDGSLLRRLMTMGGVDEDGGNVQTCRLVGTYRLTKSMSEEEYAATVEHFPELNIIQPQFVCIKIDQTVEDGEKITNLDNSTGYDSGTEFVASSHILEVLEKRHCVLAKKTAEGEMTCYQLHDETRNKYADSETVENATDAVLTGEEGEVYVYEPHYWYKGVTDVLNQTLYGFISSNENAPEQAGYTSVKLIREELDITEGVGIRKHTDYATLEAAKNEYASGSFGLVDVRGYRQVRFPGFASTIYGAAFVDDAGKIISRISVSNSNGFVNGMYLFCQVPEGATRLAFTFLNSVDFDYVLLTTSSAIEAIEPDWVEHKECLGGAYEAYLIDDVLRSVSGVTSAGTISQGQAIKYAQNRGKGFQLFDWEMHKDAGNLFFFKSGNTDSQGVCGYGTGNYQKITGLTNALGMRDTVSYYKEKGGANTQAEGAFRDGVNYQSVNLLGYENFQGNKAEWLQNVTVNKLAANGKWFITMPDGTERVVQGITVYNADVYPTHMVWGRHMDLIAAKEGGSTSSYWFDRIYISSALTRVVYRSYYYASALGGVSCAGANYDSSVTSAAIGVRLAFRGVIRWAKSVAEFKALGQKD